MNGRQIRFIIELPDKNDNKFWFTPEKRRKRSDTQAFAEWEKACRQRWRALALVIKAKLEAAESGITEFEDEFLAHILIPDGSGDTMTAGEFLRPQIDAAYETGTMPKMIPYLGSKE